MARPDPCPACGRISWTRGATLCSYCLKPFPVARVAKLSFEQAVREAARSLRQLTTEEQQEALQWLEQNLRLKRVLDPLPEPSPEFMETARKVVEESKELLAKLAEYDKSGASPSSIQPLSSEEVGPANLSNGNTSDEPEPSPEGSGPPEPPKVA